jgi:FAD/FMN-containing dehydrogenase
VGPAAEHGLEGLSGSAPDVCVTGYALGGGAGWMVRRYGLAANSIRAAEVVTADGRQVQADAGSEPDLFWALRGGGGSFGVVTALELELFPVRELYAGVLFWPQERAPEVLEAWRAWTEGAPEEMSSLGRLLNVPPLEHIPEPVRGRSFVVVEAAWLGDEASGSQQLAVLRGLDPEMDTFAMIAPPGLAALHMDPPEPVPFAGDGMLLGDLPAEAIDALVGAAGPGTDSPLLSLGVLPPGRRGRAAGPRARRARRDRRLVRAVCGGDGHEPRDGAGHLAAHRPGAGRAGAMGPRPVPQLHRAPGEHGPDVHRRGLPPPTRGQVEIRPRQHPSSQPRDPTGGLGS